MVLKCGGNGKGDGDAMSVALSNMPTNANNHPMSAQRTVQKYSSTFLPNNDIALMGNSSKKKLLSVSVPDPLMVRQATRQRGKRPAEKANDKAKKKNKVDGVYQRAGMKQVVTFGSDDRVVVNGKTIKNCTFCNGFGKDAKHKQYTNCPERQCQQRNAHEYILTTKDNSNGQSTLRERILNSMPVNSVINPIMTKPYNQLSTDLLSRNFTINSAEWTSEHAAMSNRNVRRIEFMCFHVSFLASNGMVDADRDGIVVDGSCMNSLITHSKVARKFVYDRTPPFYSPLTATEGEGEAIGLDVEPVVM